MAFVGSNQTASSCQIAIAVRCQMHVSQTCLVEYQNCPRLNLAQSTRHDLLRMAMGRVWTGGPHPYPYPHPYPNPSSIHESSRRAKTTSMSISTGYPGIHGYPWSNIKRISVGDGRGMGCGLAASRWLGEGRLGRNDPARTHTVKTCLPCGDICLNGVICITDFKL